jgi:hypothetical protein
MTPSTTNTPALESPSLVQAGAVAPAYEMKFLVNETLAAEVQKWGEQELARDPHGDPALGGAYRTTTLYCDTPDLAVYRGAPSYRRSKYRARRYGTEGRIFLERKAKWGDRVEKRRTTIAEREVPLLAGPLALPDWPGHWFHQRLQERALRPAGCVSYQRTAYMGMTGDGPMRLTLDRGLRGWLTEGWHVGAEEGRPLAAGSVIVELKFRATLPVPFKELIAGLRLAPAVVSKYKLCRQAWEAR